jgi:protein disulfide-isomerase
MKPMRAAVFIVLGLIIATGSASADEKLPALRVGTNVYNNVTVTAVTATDVYFTHAGGMGNARLKLLSPELQKHFGYDAGRAGAAEQKRMAANAQFRQQAAQVKPPAPRPPAAEEASPPVPAQPASGLSWGTDLPSALNQAKSENKTVLLDFTGSDWCGWCIKFDKDVLSTDKFAAYAGSKLVLVRLDYPHHKAQDDALKKANAELSKRFGVDGFPTFVLLNSAGKELGRQTGYLQGGPDAFIAELEGFSRR